MKKKKKKPNQNKKKQKKHTQTKPDLSYWSKIDVVAVNYPETKESREETERHTLGALKMLNGAQVS